MVNKTDLFYQYPNSSIQPQDVLFTLPNQFTGGMFINFWLAAVYGVMFVSAATYQQTIKKSSLFASFITFIVTFILVLLSNYVSTPIAGGNQLIPATVLLIGNIVWNYLDTGANI